MELSSPLGDPFTLSLYLSNAILDKPWSPGELNRQVVACYRREEVDSESDSEGEAVDSDDIMFLNWGDGDDHRFYGKSSCKHVLSIPRCRPSISQCTPISCNATAAHLIHTARELKGEVVGSPVRPSPPAADEVIYPILAY